MAINHDGEIYPPMLNELHCTFGVSFSCCHCCGHRGHGLWPSWSWFVAIVVMVVAIVVMVVAIMVMVCGRHCRTLSSIIRYNVTCGRSNSRK